MTHSIDWFNRCNFLIQFVGESYQILDFYEIQPQTSKHGLCYHEKGYT